MAQGRNPLAAHDPASAAKKEDGSLTVSEAVGTAKKCVNALPTLSVVGEVTGFRGPNARSGHCYFQVKDDKSAMDVIVWKNTYRSLGFDLRDGMSVVLHGKFDVYEGTGRLSFIARRVDLAGEGMLRQQVAALARKLEAEGLMDPARKRPIPRFCMRVAVVTSLSGSVIDDVKRTLRRRNPLVQIDVVGCAVQGPGAPVTIIRALKVAAAARPEAILLVRGGGSFEDLMTFNDEAVARAVAGSAVPVITGIGHEPDTSICDMVSDRRSSTPTAAAESVAPAIDEVVALIEQRRQRMGAALESLVQRETARTDGFAVRAGQSLSSRVAREGAVLDGLARRRSLEDPLWVVEERINQVMQSEQRLHDAMPRVMERERRNVNEHTTRLENTGTQLTRSYDASLARFAASLEALSPLKVLSRGYAIARDERGHVLDDASDVVRGQHIEVLLGKGAIEAEVIQTRNDAV